MLCYACCRIAPFSPGYWTTKGWQRIAVSGEKNWFCPDCAARILTGDVPDEAGDWDMDDNWMNI